MKKALLIALVLWCADISGALALGTRIVQTTQSTGGSTGDISVTASCASNESVTGGGFAGP